MVDYVITGVKFASLISVNEFLENRAKRILENLFCLKFFIEVHGMLLLHIWFFSEVQNCWSPHLAW